MIMDIIKDKGEKVEDDDNDAIDQLQQQSPFKSPPKFIKHRASIMKTPAEEGGGSRGGREGSSYIDTSLFPLSTPSWTPKTTTTTTITTSATPTFEEEDANDYDSDATLSATPTISTPGSSIFKSIDEEEDEGNDDDENDEKEIDKKGSKSPFSPASASPYQHFKVPSSRKQQQPSIPLQMNKNSNTKLIGQKRKHITSSHTSPLKYITLDDLYQSIIIFKCIECECIIGDSTMIIDSSNDDEQEQYMIDNHSYLLSKIGSNVYKSPHQLSSPSPSPSPLPSSQSTSSSSTSSSSSSSSPLLKCKKCNHTIGKIHTHLYPNLFIVYNDSISFYFLGSGNSIDDIDS